MNKLSNILGRPVISLYNGQIEGTIINASFDKKMQKIKHLLILDEPIESTTDDMLNEIKILATKDVYIIGQDAIIVRNNSCIFNYSTLEPDIQYMNPINSEVYTVLGKRIGKIFDINFDNNFNVISCVIDDNNEVSIEKLATLGNGLVLMQDKNKEIEINRFRIKRPSVEKTSEPIKILRKDSPVIQNFNIDKHLSTTLPLKITGSADILLGRVITQNLYNQSKELIAKKGNIITQNVIKNARKNGKIKELYIFSA